jgi:hypothetical protein
MEERQFTETNLHQQLIFSMLEPQVRPCIMTFVKGAVKDIATLDWRKGGDRLTAARICAA